MSSKSMKRWLPCQAACEMAGSANFFLSIRDSAVLIHGPRWCSSIASAEMAAIEKKYERQFYCSEVRQADLVFGASEEIIQGLTEIKDEAHPALTAVLNSCAVSLIGDDLEGVCRHAHLPGLILTMDSGGLRGEFTTGYVRAMKKLLETVSFVKEKRIPHSVNIIGWSTAYPGWQGNLAEIRRMLQKIGISLQGVLGNDGMTLTDVAHLPEAELNLVLYPELGLGGAQWLKENTGTPYAVLPIPYGLTGSRRWLSQVAEALAMTPDWKDIDAEICCRQEKIDLATFRLKGNNRNFLFGDVYAALTEGMARGLVPALLSEFPDMGDIHLRWEGPCTMEMMEGTLPWAPFEKISIPEGELALVLGNTNTRQEVGHYRQAIYKNILTPCVTLTVPEKCYAGFAGWQFFLSDIFTDFYTLGYMGDGNCQSMMQG